MACGQPIRVPSDAKVGLRALVSRTITANQLLILSEIDGTDVSVSSFLRRISKENDIPLSTLKLGLKALRSMGLVLQISSREGGPCRMEVTKLGSIVAKIMI